MKKTLDSYFRDWEVEVFGCGYGTGEEHVLGALKQFCGLLDDGRTYDYRMLEAAMTPTVAWLMINALGRDGCIDYGTSPRHGWLNQCGARVKAYVDGKTLAELCDVVWGRADDRCCKQSCRCGPWGRDPTAICPNPFWRASAPFKEG